MKGYPEHIMYTFQVTRFLWHGYSIGRHVFGDWSRATSSPSVAQEHSGWFVVYHD